MNETKKLRIAVIGQGRSGRNIHGVYLRSEENTLFEVAYVVEADPARRERAEQEYPGCITLCRPSDLYGIEGIDLVVNTSYSDTHYSITYDLLKHGFNVLVEKPFAKTLSECEILIALAKEKGLTLAVFQQTFLAPIYTQAVEVLESGKIGRLLQASIHYNGFGRRWDWQTIQVRMAGSIYNTGPHPIGMGLGFLGFDPETRLVASKLDLAFTSGDAEDYAKLVFTAPGKALVDVETISCDPFNDYTVKLIGTKGTYQSNYTDYKIKYIVDGENPPRPVEFASLKNEEGKPAYCGETLIFHEEEGKLGGTAFDVAVKRFYEELYAKITRGEPMTVLPEHAAQVISIIEQAHAQNPLPVVYTSTNSEV